MTSVLMPALKMCVRSLEVGPKKLFGSSLLAARLRNSVRDPWSPRREAVEIV